MELLEPHNDPRYQQMRREAEMVMMNARSASTELAQSYQTEADYWHTQATNYAESDPPLSRLASYRQGAILRTAAEAAREATPRWPSSKIKACRQEAVRALRLAFDSEPDGTWLKGKSALQLGFTLLELDDVEAALAVAPFADATPFPLLSDAHPSDPLSPYQALQWAIQQRQASVSTPGG